jgi:two-component system chemotaxis response regulator CheY
MRMIISRILVEAGFEVRQAGDGAEALEVMKGANDSIELVLADWNMPRMDGLDFVLALRAQDRFRDVRIIMVTTETEISQMCRALEAGANEYVMKPFTSDAVKDKLRLVGALE